MRNRRGKGPRELGPLWRWVVLGWLVAAVPVARWVRPPGPDVVTSSTAPYRVRWELDELSARELRALPGIGPTRARGLVEARWETPGGHLERLEDVPGVGPRTAAQAGAFLERQRVSREGSPPLPLPNPPRVRAVSGAPTGTLGPHDPPER